MTQPIDPRIIDFIQANHVLSLSVRQRNALWAANLFYCADFSDINNISLIVVSDLSTQHGQWMLETPEVAGTIAGQPRRIADIRGLQFQGHIDLLSDEKAAQAEALFYTQFAEAKGRHAPIWRINCNLLKYTDNNLGFGTKLLWSI